MFEREIKFIYDFNLNKVKQLGAQITFPGLKSAQLHPAIIQYISAEIDYLIYEDRQNLLQHSSFDYSGEEISKYFNLISEEIKKEKKLSFEYVDQLLLQATSFTVNYLAQPSWSLSKFIFEREESIPVSKARQIINYVYYYEFIKVITEKYFKKKNLHQVNKKEFESLLQKIDREIFDQYSDKLLNKVLNSMGDFFNSGSIKKTQIPLSAIERFLKEKNLEEYLQRIHDAFYPDPKYSYEITEIQKILYAPVPVKKDRYIDRVVKQETPDSMFKAPQTKAVQETGSDQDTHESPEHETRNESGLREDEAANISAGEPAQNEVPEIPETIIDDEELSEKEEAFFVQEDPDEKTLSDKEDPGNLDTFEDADTISLYPEEEQSVTEDTPETDEEEFPVKESPQYREDENSDETIEIIETPDESATIILPKPPHEAEVISKDDSEIDEEVKQTSEEMNREVPDTAETHNDEHTIANPYRLLVDRKDLSSFLSGKEMERIIENIFHEDTEDFALTFERLGECETEEDATNILEGVFNSYRVKSNSKEAVLLRKAVHEYFEQ